MIKKLLKYIVLLFLLIWIYSLWQLYFFEAIFVSKTACRIFCKGCCDGYVWYRSYSNLKDRVDCFMDWWEWKEDYFIEIGFFKSCYKEANDWWTECTSSNDCRFDCVTNKVSDLWKKWICEQTNRRMWACYTPIEEEYISCLGWDIMMQCSWKNIDYNCDIYKWSSYFD